MLVHTVLFNLSPEMTAEQRAAFEADVRAMAQVETVRHLFLGKPAATPQREVIFKDFDYKLTVIVDDVAGHDVYQDHPLHHQFVANQKGFFVKVRVFDSE